ncbi:MAG: redoxin family protein [Bacteroidota bacterium]
MRAPALLLVALLTLSACATDADDVALDDPAPEAAAEPAPTPGAPAPAFTLTDTNGTEHALADFAGQTVVLEWLNYDCPYVGKHYTSGNMPALQERFTDEGVVWLSVVSSAPGEQGHFEPAVMNERTASEGGQQTAVLLDPEGTVGRLYDAQTTPQMVVINEDGTVVYNGAIDDKNSTDLADVETATSYIIPAIAAAQAGTEADPATTQPYGCSVKYATDEAEA